MFARYKWCAIYIFLAKDRQSNSQILNNFRWFLLKRKVHLSLKKGRCWGTAFDRNCLTGTLRCWHTDLPCLAAGTKSPIWMFPSKHSCLQAAEMSLRGCQHNLTRHQTISKATKSPHTPWGWSWAGRLLGPGITGWGTPFILGQWKKKARWDLSGHLLGLSDWSVPWWWPQRKSSLVKFSFWYSQFSGPWQQFRLRKKKK